jgi:DNA-binding Lrp family transcriptional regulator
VARRKAKSGSARLSVFKGREARLNRAIFQILALKGPLTIYDIHKEVKAQRGLKHTKYTNVLRRIRALEESGYLEKAGTRKTLPGYERMLYKLTSKTYLALLLNKINLDSFIQTADEDTITAMLAAIIQNKDLTPSILRLNVTILGFPQKI